MEVESSIIIVYPTMDLSFLYNIILLCSLSFVNNHMFQNKGDNLNMNFVSNIF